MEGIKARAESKWPFTDSLVARDIPALIAYIEALEDAGIAVLMETVFEFKPATGEPIVDINNTHGPAHRKLRDLLAGLPVPEALANIDAMESAGDDTGENHE